MTLTTRGIALSTVVAVAFLLAQVHGARALGAVVVPGVVVLGVAMWQVRQTSGPTVTRDPPEEGPVGRRGTVRLTVESTDAGQLLVRDRLPAGLTLVAPADSKPDRSDDAPHDASAPDTGPASSTGSVSAGGSKAGSRAGSTSPFGIDVPGRIADWFGIANWLELEDATGDEDTSATVRAVSDSTTAYDVRYGARGEWSLGPAQIVVRDALGLFERVYETDDTDTVLVFPPVRRLLPDAYRQLLTAAGTGSGEERTVFDGLREYDPGDSLRDIHWRTSAKRDELVVTEYTEGSTDDRVTIVARGTPDSVDAMAEAAGSLAIALLDAGIPVALRLPGTAVAAGPGDRRVVLASLARLTAADVSSEPIASADNSRVADVRVQASADRVDVEIGDVRSRFETLVGEARDAERSRKRDSTWFSDRQAVIGPNRHGETSTVEKRTSTAAEEQSTP